MSHPSFALLLALTIPSLTQSATPTTVASLRDRYRPLLVFQPAKDERFFVQLRLLTAHRSELLERQIILVLQPYPRAEQMDSGIMALRSTEEDRELRRRFHVHPNNFTVILLGKDGGEKFRSRSPVTIDQLTRVVDAMPMRQSEMRHPR